MVSKRFFLLTCAAAISLTACAPVKNIEEGQYWQRANVSESVYIRGGKAQQMLNRDIAGCVTELKELERLGVLKSAIPASSSGRVLDPDELELEDWDTPERDGRLWAEHGNYHDFETCMLAHGWERIEYVPYDVAERARDVYIQEHIDYKYKDRYEKPKKRRSTSSTEGDFSNLNE